MLFRSLSTRNLHSSSAVNPSRSSATQALAKPTTEADPNASLLRASNCSAAAGWPLCRCMAPQQTCSCGTRTAMPRCLNTSSVACAVDVCSPRETQPTKSPTSAAARSALSVAEELPEALSEDRHGKALEPAAIWRFVGWRSCPASPSSTAKRPRRKLLGPRRNPGNSANNHRTIHGAGSRSL